MPGISDTAYPRLKSNPSAKELDEVYTPNIVELVYAEKRTREPVPRVGFLLLLKTFQRLGYFVRFHEIPTPVVEHVARCTGYEEIPSGLGDYDASSVRRRHMVLVREFVGVRMWDEAGERVMEQACEEAARTRDDLADIINVGIEELVRQRHELPAFSTMLRAAQTARAQVNRRYQAQVCAALGDIVTANIQTLLTRPAYETQSQWDRLKNEPKQPTVRHTKDFLDHLEWLRGPGISAEIFAGIPDVKVKQFAAEARSLDLSSMNDLTEPKKLTLTAALVVTQIARTLDDVADMFVRLVQKLHNEAYDALLQHQIKQVERTDSLVNTLREVTLAYRTEGTAEQRLAAIGEWIGPEADHILTMCEEHEATAGHNYLPFLIRFYSNQRAALFRFLESVAVVSTSHDNSVAAAIRFLVQQKASRLEWLPIIREEIQPDGAKQGIPLVELSFVPDKWWPLVTGNKKRDDPVTRVGRRWFELCVMTQVMQDLKSGDLCVPGSDRYSDYREQLVSEEECQQGLASYGERAGVPTDPREFVAKLRAQLEQRARNADEGYPRLAAA